MAAGDQDYSTGSGYPPHTAPMAAQHRREMEYMTIMESSSTAFDRAVNAAVRDGCALDGGMIVTDVPGEGAYYYQRVVKFNEPPAPASDTAQAVIDAVAKWYTDEITDEDLCEAWRAHRSEHRAHRAAMEAK